MREQGGHSGSLDLTEGAVNGRIMVVDEALLADALALVLAAQGYAVEAVAPTELHAVRDTADAFAPDLVVYDVAMEAEVDFDRCDPVRALVNGGHRVVLLTSTSDELLVARALEAGAEDLIPRHLSVAELVGALRAIAGGRSMLPVAQRGELMRSLAAHRQRERQTAAVFESLTEGEAAVLSHLVVGHRAQEIADERYVSVATVRTQIHSVLSKLGVNSQLAAVATAVRSGWYRDLS